MATIETSDGLQTAPRPRVRGALPWALLLGAAALVLAHLPLVALHLRQIWLRPHYQFVPLIVLGAGVLAAVRLRGFRAPAAAAGRGTWVLAATAGVLLVAAELLYSPWLGTVAALLALGAVVLGLGGGPLLRQLWPAWALLWLAVPPPFELDRELILWLQGLTTRWSSRVLDGLGVLHLMAGNVVEIDGRQLLVEEACSGINSLFTVLACTLFLVFLLRRPPIRAALLVAAAVAWVLAANVARVVIIAGVSARWGQDLTTGWRHDALGFGLFVVALALLWSTDRLLEFLAAPGAQRPVPRPAPPSGGAAPAESPPAGRRRPWFATWPVGLAYLGAFAFYVAAYAGEPSAPWPSAPEHVADLGAEALPPRCDGWERGEFATQARNPGSAYGELSRTWSYHHGAAVATLSLDYPFPAWHDLTRCYTGQGWVIDEEAVQAPPGAEGPPGGYVDVRLSKPGYRSAHLMFCQFDGHGEPLAPRLGGAHLAVQRHESALRRLLRRGDGTPEAPRPEPAGPIYQLQLFSEGYAPPTPAESQQARALFVQAWQSLRQHWPE